MRFFALVPALAILAAACQSTTGGEQTFIDPRACPQTYEFGNYGCTVISGHVSNAAGQGVTGASVGAVYRASIDHFNSPFVNSGLDGAFRFQVTRYSRPPASGPDTLSLYVVALGHGANDTAITRDSVLVHVTIAPVGSIPSETTVALRLP